LYPEAYHQGIDVYGQQLSKAKPTMSQNSIITPQTTPSLARTARITHSNELGEPELITAQANRP
jgi:hypothetical protein